MNQFVQRQLVKRLMTVFIVISAILGQITPVMAVVAETNSYGTYWQRYINPNSQATGQLSPMGAVSYLDKGAALEQQGLWNQALQVYIQGLKVNPNDPVLVSRAQRIYALDANNANTGTIAISPTPGTVLKDTTFPALVPSGDIISSVPILPAQAPEAAFTSTFPYKVNAFTAPSSPRLIQGTSMGCCPSCASCLSTHPKMPIYATFSGPIEEPAQAFVAIQPQYKTLTKKIPYKTSYRKTVGYKTLCKKVTPPCGGASYYQAIKVPVTKLVTATRYMHKKYRIQVNTPMAAAALVPQQTEPKIVTSSSSNATETGSTAFLTTVPMFGRSNISRIVAMRIREQYDAEAYEAYRLKSLKDPYDLDSRLSLATMDIDRYRFDESKINLYDVLAKDPNNAEAYWLLGQADFGLAQYDKATADYEQAMAIMPDNPYLNAEYVLTLQRTGQWDKASQFTAAKTQAPFQQNIQQSVSAVPILTGPEAATGSSNTQQAFVAVVPSNQQPGQLITLTQPNAASTYEYRQQAFSAVVPNARGAIQLQPQVQTTIQSGSLRGSQSIIQNYLSTGGSTTGPRTLFWMNGQALPSTGHDQDVRYPYVLTRP